MPISPSIDDEKDTAEEIKDEPVVSKQVETEIIGSNFFLPDHYEM